MACLGASLSGWNLCFGFCLEFGRWNLFGIWILDFGISRALREHRSFNPIQPRHRRQGPQGFIEQDGQTDGVLEILVEEIDLLKV